MTIDILAQFHKLCGKPSTDPEVMLITVQTEIYKQVNFSDGHGENGDRPHWLYDINRLTALRELKAAIVAEMKVEA